MNDVNTRDKLVRLYSRASTGKDKTFVNKPPSLFGARRISNSSAPLKRVLRTDSPNTQGSLYLGIAYFWGAILETRRTNSSQLGMV